MIPCGPHGYDLAGMGWWCVDDGGSWCSSADATYGEGGTVDALANGTTAAITLSASSTATTTIVSTVTVSSLVSSSAMAKGVSKSVPIGVGTGLGIALIASVSALIVLLGIERKRRARAEADRDAIRERSLQMEKDMQDNQPWPHKSGKLEPAVHEMGGDGDLVELQGQSRRGELASSPSVGRSTHL